MWSVFPLLTSFSVQSVPQRIKKKTPYLDLVSALESVSDMVLVPVLIRQQT